MTRGRNEAGGRCRAVRRVGRCQEGWSLLSLLYLNRTKSFSHYVHLVPLAALLLVPNGASAVSSFTGDFLWPRQVRLLHAHLAHRLSSSHAPCLLTASRPIVHMWEAQWHHTSCLICVTAQQPPPSLTARVQHSFPGLSCSHTSPFKPCWKGWCLSQGRSGY